MHLRRLSNLLCSCMKRTVQWQQWMQQGKSCSPNDAKPSKHISPQCTKVAISIRLGMDQRQPRKPLWTTLRQAEDSYYEPIHCGFKQDCKTRCKCAAANVPCMPYVTLKETSMQTSLMTVFESSSRFCVSCCNFISFQVTNLLSPVGTLDCDFWIDSLQIFRGFHSNTYITISYIHRPSIRLQWTQSKLNYKSASSIDLLLWFWPSFGFVVTFCSTRSTNLVFFCK